jgi:hypothetical protein
MTLASLYEVAKAQKNVLDIITGQIGADRMTTVKMAGAAPSNPQQYDVWIDTSANNKIRVYDGSNWLAVTV